MTLDLRRLDTQQSSFDREFADLLDWSNRENPHVVETAQNIIDSVRREGDGAVIKFTSEFDRWQVKDIDDLVITADAMREAWQRLPRIEREDLQCAASRIWAYHENHNVPIQPHRDEFDNQLEVRVSPLKRVGVYVPGGQAAYPSTVLMTVVPAKVAGVDEIIVTMPTPDRQVNDNVLAALYLVQPSRCYSIGGAQAIATLAYGTQSIPRVDKIVGPGGAFVAAAKKLVYGPVGIESLAGPSEILVIADGSTPVEWTAWDLMSQAEHDAHAQAILISPAKDYLDRVAQQIEINLEDFQRAEIARASFKDRGAMIQTRNLAEAFSLANRIAPEHLELAVEKPREHLDEIHHAGAIFLGPYSSEALGDYVAGPSHVLPTFGTARYASVLGVQDFLKRTSIIEITEQGAQPLGKVASRLAEAEGLHAHAEAANSRIKDYGDNH